FTPREGLCPMRSLPAAVVPRLASRASGPATCAILGLVASVASASCGESGSASRPAASPAALSGSGAAAVPVAPPLTTPAQQSVASTEAAPEAPAGIDRSEVASRAVDALRDAFNAHDADKVADAYTADC